METDKQKTVPSPSGDSSGPTSTSSSDRTGEEHLRRNEMIRENEQTVPAIGPEAWETELCALLKKEPELRSKLIEALETDHFFVTLSCQLVRPGRKEDLAHFYCRHKFAQNDVVTSLQHLARDFIAKENPTADLGDNTAWH